MQRERKKLDYSLISKYRTVLMGIAIIFIMFCHMDVAQAHNDISKTSLARALHIFTVGVDIFMFVSGIGLYYSYTKKQQSYSEFEKKRLVRILPSYFVIGGVTYLLYDILIKRLGALKFLRDLLFISWFQEGTTRYWYILAIVVFYLLFPVLYRFIHSGKNGLLKTILFSICWWIVIEILCKLTPSMESFRIALARLPIFAIGIYFGKLSHEGREVKKSEAAILLLAGYILFVGLKTPILKPVSGYLYYPVRALLGISIIITVIILMEMLEIKAARVNNGVGKVFSWFGGLTLELYLLHQSYMILLEFPYKMMTYLIAAFILPTITAGIVYMARKIIKPAKG